MPDEGQDVESSVFPRNLNLRIQRRVGCTGETERPNVSCGSAASSESDKVPYMVILNLYTLKHIHNVIW